MKQKFFDILNGGWEEQISDTYEKSNKLTYYDKTIGKGGIINKLTKKVNSSKDIYEETYMTNDEKYIIRLCVMVGAQSRDGKKRISCSIDLKKPETYVTLSYINSILAYNELLFISMDDHQDTYIDSKFVSDFINRACAILNKHKHQAKNPFKQETINDTIEHIKKHTKEY